MCKQRIYVHQAIELAHIAKGGEVLTKYSKPIIEGSKNALFANPTASLERMNRSFGSLDWSIYRSAPVTASHSRESYLFQPLDCAEYSIPHSLLQFHLLDFTHQPHNPRQGLSSFFAILLGPLPKYLIDLPR